MTGPIILILPDGKALGFPGEAEFRAALSLGAEFASPAQPPLGGQAFPPRLVDSRELGELLGVGDTKLEAMAATGEIPSMRIGKALRFDASDVLRHLKSLGHAVNATAPHVQPHDLHGGKRPNNQKTNPKKCRKTGRMPPGHGPDRPHTPAGLKAE